MEVAGQAGYIGDRHGCWSSVLDWGSRGPGFKSRQPDWSAPPGSCSPTPQERRRCSNEPRCSLRAPLARRRLALRFGPVGALPPRAHHRGEPPRPTHPSGMPQMANPIVALAGSRLNLLRNLGWRHGQEATYPRRARGTSQCRSSYVRADRGISCSRPWILRRRRQRNFYIRSAITRGTSLSLSWSVRSC